MKYNFQTRNFEDLNTQANKLAVAGSNRDLTWQEFKSEVDNLIELLESKGLNELEKPVLVYGHKQAEMIVCFYALMSLDITYIPIDSSYPEERIRLIIESSESELFINLEDKDLPFENINYINLSENTFQLNQTITLRKNIQENPINYIIYTSGSTGAPKGVQISKEAIVNFTDWMARDFGFNENEVFVNTAILSFDLSVFEVMTFGKLGGTIVLTSKEEQENPISFLDKIEKCGGSTLVATPSFMLKYSKNEYPEKVNSLCNFLFCGEVLPHNLAKNLLANYPECTVFNTYGPTEATVATTIIRITNEILETYNPLPVGYAKSDTQLLIENDEIIIVGKNVSSGYVKNEELNQNKFVERNGMRAFKTGDLGYFENDLLFFKGRNDDLIKLHGYRIELNEISTALQKVAGIENNVVLALKRNGIAKKIVAFVETKSDLSNNLIKDSLANHIPSYMIPSDFRQVSDIPLNANGKLDKKLLEEIYLGRK